MVKELEKYLEEDLIKSDTGENLISYWTDIYTEEGMEYLNTRFTDNLFNLMTIKREFDSGLKGFVLTVLLEKVEVILTHCLVLNKIRNIKLDIEENEIFNKLLNEFKETEEGQIVFDKVIKDFK